MARLAGLSIGAASTNDRDVAVFVVSSAIVSCNGLAVPLPVVVPELDPARLAVIGSIVDRLEVFVRQEHLDAFGAVGLEHWIVGIGTALIDIFECNEIHGSPPS